MDAKQTWIQNCKYNLFTIQTANKQTSIQSWQTGILHEKCIVMPCAPPHIMWKQSFGLKLKQYLQQEHGMEPKSDRQVYKQIHQIFTKYGIWIKVGTLCGATEKNVHDYFHNTWSKQFCDSYDQYKEQLALQMQKLVDANLSKSAAINTVIDQFQEQHPHENFHIISLRQVLWRIYDKACRIQVSGPDTQTEIQRQAESLSKLNSIYSPEQIQLPVFSEIDIADIVAHLKDMVM
ncbi:Conserved_hypothetical protein [Hexamita inflata]|uniref:Uncharacterized protein n=1 Tax=Hexamita inflata TaxID=28002 RepID=A0AA86P9P4_9EUKA|nr:Conserved hypothetical protein [Hexamita inflata]CAI9932042.1 Conserved hypothetical protein [Hexamita inflata]CAI9943463.1 Conserved hypothetical protein [Hexamita inflata]